MIDLKTVFMNVFEIFMIEFNNQTPQDYYQKY